MRKFSYDFLKEMVPGTVVNISNIIYDLRAKEQLRRKDNGDIFDHLQESAIIDSVRGSNAIEGIVTTEQRIRDIVQSGDTPPTSVSADRFRILIPVIGNIFCRILTVQILPDLVQLIQQLQGPVSLPAVLRVKNGHPDQLVDLIKIKFRIILLRLPSLILLMVSDKTLDIAIDIRQLFKERKRIPCLLCHTDPFQQTHSVRIS